MTLASFLLPLSPGMTDTKTLLIVETDPEVVARVTAHFAELGYAVDHAPDALEALIRINFAPPQAVLMGLTTPRLGGVDAIRLLRRRHPGLAIVLNDFGRLTTRTDDSGDDRGSEAWRTLDRLVEIAVAKRGAVAPLEEPLPDPAPARPRFLVVDDVGDVRDLLRDVLEAEGYAVAVAEDAAAAISLVASFKPQAVLLDIAMPGLSGIGALRHLRARDPQIGVIMVTGNEHESTARQTLALGAFDYVRKPIDFDYLRRSIQTLLALRSLAATAAASTATV